MIPINGVKHLLWRAVDANADTLYILVQTRRNAKAAKRFMARLITQFGQPRVVVTDKLRSYTSRLPIKRRKLTTAPTRDVTTGLRAVTGQHDDEKRSWAGSNHPDRHNGS